MSTAPHHRARTAQPGPSAPTDAETAAPAGAPSGGTVPARSGAGSSGADPTGAGDALAPDAAERAALERELFGDADADEDAGGPAARPPVGDPATGRVLILNASYEPLHVCSVKRAVGLLMQDVADRVEDADAVLRSPSSLFPVPSVIRLRRYVRRPVRHRVAFNRKNVFRRDEHRCQYCGAKGSDLTLDHVVPRSKGGPTTWENVVACCRRCNAVKRDRTPAQAGMTLARPPRAPRFLFTSAYGLLPDLDPIWRKYLPPGV